MNQQPPGSPQQRAQSPLLLWLADNRINVWLTRLFWLLLILETVLWTSIGPLFTRGEIIAPVLFVASKALFILAGSVVLAWISLSMRPAEGQGEGARQQLTTTCASALFLLWFGTTIVHLASALLLRLVEGASSAYGGKGSEASFDLMDALLKEMGFSSFSSVGFSYLAVSSILYGVMALGLFRLLARRRPARANEQNGNAVALPAWPWLLLAYAAISTIHGIVMRM